MLKKSLLVVSLIILSLILSACGPWSFDRECRSYVSDWSGCIPRSEETDQWLYNEGRITPDSTDAPAEPTPTAMPTATPTIAPTAEPTPMPTETQTPESPTLVCHAIHDYQLKDLTEVSTSEGNWLHVEYWVGGNAPEYETILPGGRYLLQINFAGGHVWEYPSNCTFEQVKAEVDDNIIRRLAQKANNAGYIEWQTTHFFEPVQ